MASLIKRQFKSGPVWYIQYYVGKKQKRKRASESFQIAKHKLRQHESAQFRGEDVSRPTQTPIAKVLDCYIRDIRKRISTKTAQTYIYYLGAAFGPICDGLKDASRKQPANPPKKRTNPNRDRRFKDRHIEADCFEHIRTEDLAEFIDHRVAAKKLSPRTANHFRAVLHKLFVWAMKRHRIKMPNGINPAAGVERRTENAPEIRYLDAGQIQNQLSALESDPQYQAMVATLIYAGLRREELLWLTHNDMDWNFPPYGLIHVRAKTIDTEFWQPKTKTNRTVPVSRQLRPYLDRQRLEAGKSTWFFPNASGGRFDPDNFSRGLRQHNEKLKPKWSCLDYRHTFGTQLADRNVSLHIVATLMGNSPHVVRDHYANSEGKRFAEFVEFASPTPPPQSPTTISTSA